VTFSWTTVYITKQEKKQMNENTTWRQFLSPEQ